MYPHLPKLLPTDPLKRWQVRRLCEQINASTQPVQNTSIIAEIGARFGDDKKTPWVQWVVIKGLTAFEKLLESSKGTYCVGDEVTLADFFLIPQLFTAARFEVDTSQWPLISEVHENLKKLEIYDIAHANNQIDALK